MSCVEHKQVGDKMGYGRGSHLGRKCTLHRKHFCSAHGLTLDEIKGVVIMHTCDNPRCINPEHLVAGSYVLNAMDRDTKGRGYTRLEFIDVHLIKYFMNEYRVGVVADLFEVNHKTISDIRLGRTWKWV